MGHAPSPSLTKISHSHLQSIHFPGMLSLSKIGHALAFFQWTVKGCDIEHATHCLMSIAKSMEEDEAQQMSAAAFLFGF